MNSALPPALSAASPAFVARAPGNRDLGRLAPGRPITLGVLLRYRNEVELRALVRLQGERGSPVYKHYLTNAQWNGAFAPDHATVTHALTTLARAGFRIGAVPTNRDYVLVTAPVKVVERTFSTELHAVARGTEIAFANVRPIRIPDALRSSVAAVSGFDGFSVAHYPLEPRVARSAAFTPTEASHSMATPKPVSTTTPGPNPSPEATLLDSPTTVTNGVGNGYGAVAIAVAYDFPVMHGYGGRGRALADVIGAPYREADYQAFIAAESIPRTGTTNHFLVDGGAGPNPPAAAIAEADLDIEVVAGLAPAITYDSYEFPPPGYDYVIEDAYNQIVADNFADVVNSSFVNCEKLDPAVEYAEGYLALQGAAKGITFAAATGDGGPFGCYLVGAPQNTVVGVGVPAADQYFTAVGGTNLAVNPNDGTYVNETGDNVGGAGTSIFEARPNWQASTRGTDPAGRAIPDVAMQAASAPGYEVYASGISVPTGGTSEAAPMFASMIAEIDEIQGTRNGWVNPRLYQIFNAQGYTWAFRDITVGSNGMQNAGTGFDALTGIGSPLGWELAGEL